MYRNLSKLALLLMLILATACQAPKERQKKAVFIILDGIPADMIERLDLPAIKEISSHGGYAQAYCGGDTNSYNETPTISAVGYSCILTSAWANKHNVWDNSPKVNYSYPSIFYQAKMQERQVKTALYSSWIDNRTVLLGEGLPQTNHLKIDYVFDGLDTDTLAYPKEKDDLHIFKIDEAVSMAAAKGISEDAPDLSWVYLWYTDDASHIYGNGEYFDEYTRKADIQVSRIWEAVKYREANFDEDWMVVVTTDHGRSDDGYGHGGQSSRERTCWIATNQKANNHFSTTQLAITDINPSICRFLGFKTPTTISWEQDGIPFIGNVDIEKVTAKKEGSDIKLKWIAANPNVEFEIYGSKTNNFREGREDNWEKITTIKGANEYQHPQSSDSFVKYAVVTPNNSATCWVE